MNKAVIYASQQTTDAKSMCTVFDQITVCEHYALKTGLQIEGIYSDALSDEWSKRAEEEKMLEVLRTGKANILLVFSLNRLSADQQQVIALVEECIARHVSVMSMLHKRS